MNKLSQRNNSELSCRSGIETCSSGGNTGISTSARKFWRKYFSGVQGMQGTNDQLNYLIALDFSSAEPVHRFILRSGEAAEIRKSQKFYYLCVIRKNNRQDVIVIQPSMKTVPPETSKKTMSPEWLEGVQSGKIKRRTK